MSRENIDEILDDLYQQRKKGLTTPNIESKRLFKANKLNNDMDYYPEKSQKSIFKVTKFTTIISVTFVTSFSIFALINQLQHTDNKNINNNDITIHRDIELKTEKKPVPKKDVVEKITLPKTPVKNDLPITSMKPITSPPSSIEITPVIPQVVINFDSIIPKIAPTKLELVLIKKVLPQYPIKAKKERLSGVVKLSYWVNHDGEVDDIKIIATTNSHIFNKAAIKALKQWQYDVNSLKIAPNDRLKHEIEFDFTLNKLK
jgi:protein TonB